MTNRFMISVAAAALIAGTGFASAQGPGRDAPSAGSPAQQSAPAERAAPSAAPMNRDGASDSKGSDKGVKSTQTDEKLAPKGSKSAQDDVKPGMKGEKSAQDNMKGEKSKSTETTQDKGAASKDMKADSKGATDSKSQTTTQAPAGKDSKSQTTGNAATSATAAPPAEKRTEIVSVIRSEKSITETTNVNFNISVGVAVPSTVRFYPLPPRIVEIYPEWRGYQVILVGGRYVIIRPQTREIVYIIEG